MESDRDGTMRMGCDGKKVRAGEGNARGEIGERGFFDSKDCERVTEKRGFLDSKDLQRVTKKRARRLIDSLISFLRGSSTGAKSASDARVRV